MMYVKLIVLLNLTISATLTGLIWVVQVVHYPGFHGVGTESFLAYQHNHMRTISYVVISLMVTELVVALLLPALDPFRSSWLAYTATGMVLIVWITTFFISSPLHGKLATTGYDASLIHQLVATNWIRTMAWTVRTGILFFVVLEMMRS